MSPASSTPQHDPGGTIHLRPHSATALSVVVGLVAAALTLDAVIRAGWEGVAALPLLLLVVVLVWMLLWAPRVVLHEEAVEVRNIFVTHHLPFAALTDIRIGAMLRLETTTPRGEPATVTAWNAPALRRDNPFRRESSMREDGLRGRRLTPRERMAQDQTGSRSAVVKERWMRWIDRHELDGAALEGTALEGTAPTAPSEARPMTRPNLLAIVLLAVTVGLVLARLLL